MFVSGEEAALLDFVFGTIAIYGMQLRPKHRRGTCHLTSASRLW
jgi:hypothetical protein